MSGANFTRRHDLFLDSGFNKPQAIVSSLTDLANKQNLEGSSSAKSLKALDNFWLQAQKNLSSELKSLLKLAPSFLSERGGDLSTILWLAKNIGDASTPDEIAHFCLALAATYHKNGHQREAQALLRFFVALDFDYGDLYREVKVGHEFLNARDPNPFVWKCIEFVNERFGKNSKLNILELGCGIGNDAMGFLTSPRLKSYTGTDISDDAIKAHKARAATSLKNKKDIDYKLLKGDFISLLKKQQKQDVDTNFIYSYSSLHYFNSKEVKDIFELVKAVLKPGTGLFCFAIKGKGSIWDGQGVPLYRPDVWVNLDGQSRWFPSLNTLNKMVDDYGFELLEHTMHQHWSYSELGKPDNFHYVICTPRKK